MRYVPDLAESIYSLFLHVQLPGHGLESTFHEGLFINFPDFRSKAIIGKYDIYLDASLIILQTFQEVYQKYQYLPTLLPLPFAVISRDFKRKLLKKQPNLMIYCGVYAVIMLK